ncbi:MAG: hypothetical protein SOZ34_11575 [Clostridia bacterium]|nr:hypothetical protein [Clostridia bacterium]
MKEQIKAKIKETVKVIDTSSLDFVNIKEYEMLVTDNIWTRAIQTALDEKKNVYIPYMGHEIIIDGTIFMDSHTNLKVDEKQIIRLKEHTDVCMLRNRNMIPGGHAYTEQVNPDEYITVTGGIWAAPDNAPLRMDNLRTIVGGFAEIGFSNVRYVNVTNATFSRGTSYAVMISNCTNFYVDNIKFDKFEKDGIHIDGPAKFGIISNLDGVGLGDDMIAILAWDWYSSGVTNGDIEDILVENIKGDNNEIRLLAGRKVYRNGKKKDCDIRRCVFENITGIYTYKMYYQPHYMNVAWGKHFDSAETVGEMNDIYYENITVPKIRNSGFNEIPIYGIFDILADCKNLNLKNIKLEHSLEELEKKNIKLINVGPISATFKYTEDKSKWGDFFEPDMCCFVEDINLENITFDDVKVTDAEKLVKETHQSINPDYPNTLPEGGTGFGKIKRVNVK